MKIVMAEDMVVSRRALEGLVSRWGHQVISVSRGDDAVRALTDDATIDLAILDWMMPGLDGLAVCRWIRAQPAERRPYTILLTARVDKRDVVAGLAAGADDYMIKPFHHSELRARLEVGARTLELERALRGKVQQLEGALRQVRRLEGLLPICMYCKQIRDEAGQWQRLEQYIMDRSDAVFSHGMCRGCFDTHVVPGLDGPEQPPE